MRQRCGRHDAVLPRTLIIWMFDSDSVTPKLKPPIRIANCTPLVRQYGILK